MKSDKGHIVNMSSANAIRAVLGGQIPHTTYSAAKFAMQGFSESLIHDFRFNAPHLGVSVVLPGYTGTEMIANSARVLGRNQPEDWSQEECDEARHRWHIAGNDKAESLSDEESRRAGRIEIKQMRDLGMPPAEVAQIILDGVRSNQWRILIGKDTASLDQLVGENPNGAYDPDFVLRWRNRTEANNE
jgi:NAD(P)-dependent dehydrogenase (short-subunit alcohol dehydrogenase family)